MDPALSSLFPVHQIGADGFSWWIGQVESEKGADPKKSGRYQVRIVGQHLKDCDATPTSELPWANVMMPVTTPFSDGGKTGASVSLTTGNWVIGFYLDNDRQKPIIMGSVGHTAGATQRENVEKDPNPGGTCKAFTTFLDPDINPNTQAPMESSKKRSGDQPASPSTAETTGQTSPGEAGEIAAANQETVPPAFLGLFAEASATNPTGSKVCVEIANPDCGSENDLKGGLTKIVGDMLRDTQQSGGNIGSFYVSQINGELTDSTNEGMKHVNKAVLLVRSLNGRVKGEIVKQLRNGVDQLVELLLYEKVVEEAAEDGAEAANTSEIDNQSEAEEPETKKQSRIKPILDAINDVLDDLGCSMADFTDRLAKWLTDLLLGYLMDAYANAACLVDNLVDGILNQIIAFIEEFLATILGPLQELLAFIAAPIDMIGGIVAQVLGILGISCDGLPDGCEKVKKECTDCDTGESDNWLDDLLDALLDGPLDNNTYVCEEAKTTTALESLPPTNIDFIGGTLPEPEEEDNVVPTDLYLNYSSEDIEVVEGTQAVFTITRSGNLLKASSLTVTVLGGTATEGVDYEKVYSGSSVGFAAGSSTKTLAFDTFIDQDTEGEETFFIKLEENVTPAGHYVTFKGGNVIKCTIKDFDPDKDLTPPDGGDGTPTPYVPPSLVNPAPFAPSPITTVIDPTLEPTLTISADKVFYTEGETIIFTVESSNVSAGTTYNYTIDGTVDADDIEGDLTGSFQIGLDGTSTIEITTLVNDDNPDTTDDNGDAVVVSDILESLSIFVTNTTAFANVYILGDDDDLSTQPQWTVTSDVNYIREGETATFTVSALNIPDGTNFTYELVGPITRSDIVGARVLSNVDFNANPLEIINGTCVIPVTPTIDGDEDEGQEPFDFVVKSYVDENGDTQELSGVQTRVVILADSTPTDTTTTTPTYSVKADQLEYNEGDVIKYSITTTNVPSGTNLQYMLSGTSIKKSDIVSNSLFGNFQIINNEAIVYIGIADDIEVEEPETLTFSINGTGASADVIILDNDTLDIDPEPDVKKPCYTKPTAGQPITDANGSIISIPIVDSGCPYIFPPKVIITGPGYGASAIALTDSNGRVTEVRVTRSGVGYNRNEPDDKALRCVIDSYTIISPGQGYTSAPDVYIDGVAGRAQAIVDERGYVISIQPTDRTTTYKEIPKIQIIGGGGLGARVMPSVVCLDNTEYENQGYAKIGTGRYVDCP
jgi:hypothetical protein